MPENSSPNVKFTFYIDVNMDLCFGVLPLPPNRCAIEGAGAAGMVYPKALQKLPKLDSIAGASAGACTAAYYAAGLGNKFAEISRAKDLSTSLEVKHHNGIKTPEKHSAKQDKLSNTLTGLTTPITTVTRGYLDAAKKTYVVGKGLYNLLSKGGIFSGKKLAEEINFDLCKHIKEQIKQILSDSADEKIIAALKENGPLKEFKDGNVKLKTFEDVLMNDHLNYILKKIPANIQRQQVVDAIKQAGSLRVKDNFINIIKNIEKILINDPLNSLLAKIPSKMQKQKIADALKKAGNLKIRKNRLIAMRDIKNILHAHLDANLINEFKQFFNQFDRNVALVQEFKYFFDEFKHFKYLLDLEVLTFGHLNHLVKNFPKHEFGCELYIEVSKRMKDKNGKMKAVPEVFSHENKPHLPIGIATEMSMSIPIVFKPVPFEGCTFQDGGVHDNWPGKIFNDPKFRPLKGEFNQNLRTIGLYRANPQQMKILNFAPPKVKSSKVVNKLLGSDFLQNNYQNKLNIHEEFPHQVVLIPDLDHQNKPFHSGNFHATDEAKDTLLGRGETAYAEHAQNYEDGALGILKYSSVQSIADQQKKDIDNLQKQGAYLSDQFSFLELLEQKLADKNIPTEQFFPRGPWTKTECETIRRQLLTETREKLGIKVPAPTRRIKVIHPFFDATSTKPMLPKVMGQNCVHYKVRRVGQA